MQIFANQSSKIPCLYWTSKCCWAWFSLRVYHSLTGGTRSNRNKHTEAPAHSRKAFQNPPKHFHCLKQLLAQCCFWLVCLRLFCPKHWITLKSSIQGLPFPDLFETWPFPLLTLPPPDFTSWFLGFSFFSGFWLRPCLALWIDTSLSFLGFYSKELIPV